LAGTWNGRASSYFPRKESFASTKAGKKSVAKLLSYSEVTLEIDLSTVTLFFLIFDNANMAVFRFLENGQKRSH